jgi:hypothetical protein
MTKPPTQIGDRIPLDCPVCGTHTDAEIKAFFVSENNRLVRTPLHGKVFNYLLRCTRCTSGMLLIWSYEEDIRRASLGFSYTGVYPLPTSAFKTEALGGEDAIPGRF